MIEKKCLISLLYFILTLFLSFATMHIMELFTVSKLVGVGISAGLIVIACILYFTLHEKNSKIFPFVIILNALASGFALSSLFVYLEAFPLIWHTVILFAVFSFLFYLYCLLARIIFFQKHFIICIALYFILILAAAITCIALTSSPVFIVAALMSIVFLAFLISLVKKAFLEKEHMENIAKCSFVVLIVLFIVLIIISEGDADFDAFAGEIDTRKKKYNPYSFARTALFEKDL